MMADISSRLRLFAQVQQPAPASSDTPTGAVHRVSLRETRSVEGQNLAIAFR
jgi:hypothetical protein